MNAKELICTVFLTDVHPCELQDIRRNHTPSGLVYKVAPEDLEGNATWWHIDFYFDSLGPVLRCTLWEGNYQGWVKNYIISKAELKEKLFIHIHNFFEDDNPYKEKDTSEWEIKVEEMHL